MSLARELPLAVLLLTGAARAETAKGARGAPAKKVAGSVVRSKEWVVRRGAVREEEFIGDVRYDAAGTKLSADWALYRHGSNDWRVRGKVFARRQFEAGDTVETRGEEAWYDELTLKGRLEPARGGRVPLLHAPVSGAPDHAEGDRLSWVGQSVGILSGRARGWGPRGEFWAEEARYDRRTDGRTLTLSGNRPAVHDYSGGLDSAVKGDRIVAHDAPRRVVASGRAQGWIIAQSTSAPKSGPSALLCGRGSLSEGPGPDARVSALLAPAGAESPADADRRFGEAEAAAFAARACPWGPRADFWADTADYAQEPRRVLTLSGGRPVLQKIDAEQSSAIKADTIVAWADARRVEASGKVTGWIVFKEDKKASDKNAKKRPERTK